MHRRCTLAVSIVLGSAAVIAACGSDDTTLTVSGDAGGDATVDANNDSPLVDASNDSPRIDASNDAPRIDATASDPAEASADAAESKDAGDAGADVDAGSPGSGALDPSFGDGGIALGPHVTPLPDAGAVGDQVARAVTLSATGAIVVAGWAGFELGMQVAVWRFLPGGAMDPSFGVGGVFTTGDTSNVPSNDAAWSVCLDTQSRALVAGSSEHTVAGDFPLSDLAVWRLTEEGTLDPAFGTGGHLLGSVIANDAGALGTSWGSSVVCASGPYVGGGSFYGGPTVWGLTSAGALDTAGFGSPNGWVGDPNFGEGTVDALGVDDAGRTLAAGSAGDVDAGGVLWRRAADGTLDTAFAGAGRDVLAQLDAGTDAGAFPTGGLSGVASGPAGRILVSVGQPAAVVCLTAEGSLDRSFGGSGYVSLPLPPSSAVGAVPSTAAIAIDSKGRTIVLGNITSASGASSAMAVWRLTSAGALDTSFAGVGVVSFTGAVGGDYDVGHGLAVDGDDRPVVVGESEAPGALAPRSAVVWRLLP